MAFRNAQRWLVGLSVALGLAHSTAQAQQPLVLPTDIVTSNESLTSDQQTLIRQFVAQHAPRLQSDDPKVVSSARRALQQPLMGSGPSAPAAPFRFAYTSEMVRHLDDLAQSPDASKTIVALHLAGQIATERSTQIPVQHLGHADVGIRYAAARSIGLTFGSLNTSAPAVRNVPALISAVGDRLLVENNPFVLDRLIQTLRVAANLQNPVVASHRILAIDEISEGVSQRLQRLQPDKNNVHRLQMLLRGLEVVQESFLQGVFVGAPNAGRDRSVVSAAGLGGDAMVYVAKRVKGGIDKADERDLLVKIARSAETILYFVPNAHTQGVQDPSQRGTSASPLLQNGDDQGYLAELQRRYTGPGGMLVSAPFSLDPRRFDF